jgi:hypothetical protein
VYAFRGTVYKDWQRPGGYRELARETAGFCTAPLARRSLEVAVSYLI